MNLENQNIFNYKKYRFKKIFFGIALFIILIILAIISFNIGPTNNKQSIYHSNLCFCCICMRCNNYFILSKISKLFCRINNTIWSCFKFTIFSRNYLNSILCRRYSSCFSNILDIWRSWTYIME